MKLNQTVYFGHPEILYTTFEGQVVPSQVVVVGEVVAYNEEFARLSHEGKHFVLPRREVFDINRKVIQ